LSIFILIFNKKDDLEMAIAGNEPDIILITETLPKAHCNTITAACLSINGCYSYFLNFDPATVPSISVVRGVDIYASKNCYVSKFILTSLI